MGIEYDFSIKDAEDAISVDAGIEGWDAIIQINNVISRRYAASTPLSLISRSIDFRGTGADFGSGGLQLDTGGSYPLLDIGSLLSTSKARNLLFIPTMVGLMVHPQTTGAMSSTFAGCITVKNGNVGGATAAALTPAFSLTCSVVTLNNTNVGGFVPMTNITGTAALVNVPLPSTATASVTNLLTAGIASNRKGYYYLCPVNRGWWTQQNGNDTGGVPMRGFTIQNDTFSPFIPDGDLVNDPDVNYASSGTYSQILLQATAGTNGARFSIIDLYGIIIPSASAAV